MSDSVLQDFFEAMYRALKPGGIVCTQVPSFLDYPWQSSWSRGPPQSSNPACMKCFRPWSMPMLNVHAVHQTEADYGQLTSKPDGR